MESKGGKKSSIGYKIKNVRPAGGSKKFQSAAFSNDRRRRPARTRDPVVRTARLPRPLPMRRQAASRVSAGQGLSNSCSTPETRASANTTSVSSSDRNQVRLPEEIGMEQVLSDLQALKKLYGLLHSARAGENLDEASRTLLMRMLDDATQQALIRQAKLISPALERKLSIQSVRPTRDDKPRLRLHASEKSRRLTLHRGDHSSLQHSGRRRFVSREPSTKGMGYGLSTSMMSCRDSGRTEPDAATPKRPSSNDGALSDSVSVGGSSGRPRRMVNRSDSGSTYNGSSSNADSSLPSISPTGGDAGPDYTLKLSSRSRIRRRRERQERREVRLRRLKDNLARAFHHRQNLARAFHHRHINHHHHFGRRRPGNQGGKRAGKAAQRRRVGASAVRRVAAACWNKTVKCFGAIFSRRRR